MPTHTSGRVIILPAVVCMLIAGCSSPLTRTTLPENNRDQVFEAARTVLMKRFHGFRELDEEQGILVTDYKQPVGPAPTARFYATVEISEMGAGADMRVRVIQEGLSFQDLRMVWVDTGRSDGVRAVEGYIIEEVRARLENREPDIPRDPDAVGPEMESNPETTDHETDPAATIGAAREEPR